MLIRNFLITAAFLASPAFAQSEADVAAIRASADRLLEVTLSDDMTPTVDMMAPKIIEAGAKMTSLEPEKFKELMRLQVSQLKNVAQIREAGMSVDEMTWHEAADGTPYALIPTRTVIAAKAETGGTSVFEQESQTLALQDGGTWYLVRASEPAQQQMLFEAYPSMNGIELPAASTRVIEE